MPNDNDAKPFRQKIVEDQFRATDRRNGINRDMIDKETLDQQFRAETVNYKPV